MKRKKIVEGSGITERETVMYSADDKGFGKMLSQSEPTEDTIGHRERYMRRLLEAAGITTDMEAHRKGKVGSDLLRKYETPEWYAVEVLMRLDWMNKQMERGDYHGAACRAMEAGMLYRECIMKLDWEDHALRGKEVEKILNDGRKEGVNTRRQKAEEKHNNIKRGLDQLYSHKGEGWQMTYDQIARVFIDRRISPYTPAQTHKLIKKYAPGIKSKYKNQ